MGLVNMRDFRNAAGAGSFTTGALSSPFAEDFDTIRDAIQLGIAGTKTLRAESVSTLEVGGNATVTGSCRVSGDGSFGSTLSATGAVTVGESMVVGAANDSPMTSPKPDAFTTNADLSVGTDLTVAGRLDVLGDTDLGDHDHGDDESPGNPTSPIPLSSVVDVSTPWSGHSHDGDGSGEIPATAIDGSSIDWDEHDHDGDGTGTLGATSLVDTGLEFQNFATPGIVAGTLVGGDAVLSTRRNVERALGRTFESMFWTSATEGKRSNKTDPQADLTFYGEGQTGTKNAALPAIRFDATTEKKVTFAIPFPDHPNMGSARFEFFYGSNISGSGTSVVLRAEVGHANLDSLIFDNQSSTSRQLSTIGANLVFRNAINVFGGRVGQVAYISLWRDLASPQDDYPNSIYIFGWGIEYDDNPFDWE